MNTNQLGNLTKALLLTFSLAAIVAGQNETSLPLPATAIEEHPVEAGNDPEMLKSPVVLHGDFNRDGIEDLADLYGDSVTIWTADSDGTYERQEYSNLTDEQAKAWFAKLLPASSSSTASTSPALLKYGRAQESLACRGTFVGQVNGTPSGRRGETITVVAGLSQSTGLGLATALSGWVKAYVASGSTWRYLTRSFASGTEGNGFLNSYAPARFRLKISSTATPGRYIRLQYRFDAQNGYCSSVGYGSIYVRP